MLRHVEYHETRKLNVTRRIAETERLMMTRRKRMNPPTDDQLTAAFEEATAGGPDHLSVENRDLYLIEDFILEWEDGGLAEVLYDCLPDFGLLKSTVDAMKRHGLTELAAILAQAVEIFGDYREMNPPSPWRAVLERYDPTGKLAELDARIRSLPNYGLAQ